MSEENVYHRKGPPCGPPVPVGKLYVEYRDSDDQICTGELWDCKSSEIEMLRTIAHEVTVAWGKDEIGWWAIMPIKKPILWEVWRQDGNGNRYKVRDGLEDEEAQRMIDEFEASGHRQSYWRQPSPVQPTGD